MRGGGRGRMNRQGGQESNFQDRKVVGWNIPGSFENKRKKKTNFKNVFVYVQMYDVICLSECWIDKEFAMDGPDYKEFNPNQ